MNLFIRKLRNGACLSAKDETVLAALCEPLKHAVARQDLVAEGDQPDSLPVILSGWACRYRDLADGRRMIISLLLPGDLCEPFGLVPRFMDHSLAAITEVSFARIPARALTAAARSSPAVEGVLWWDALTASAIMNERAVSLGVRTTLERLGHLLCEMHLRLTLVGLAGPDSYSLPLIQQDFAQVMGVSMVHINRSLQALRAMGLITLRGRHLTIHDLVALQELSFFDPGYLHLRGASTP